MTVTQQPAVAPLPAPAEVGGAAVTGAGGRELRMARPPVFATVEEERAHRKAKLAAALPDVQPGRAATRAWPGTSRCATRSTPTRSG